MNASKDDGGRRAALCHPALVIACLILSGSPGVWADSWRELAPVPGARASHTAVWTGHELIVWGGGVDGSFLNSGARYVPSTDTWRETSPYGAPSPRWFHAAVWTGSEMIIWGGRANFFPGDHSTDGARYNPATDTWTSISGYGAPTPRSQCAAVWTGEEMIVWGGETDGGAPLADGAAYNPVTDTWRPINVNSGLAPRMEPTAVWTGAEMIVFGGVDATQPGWLSYGDGACYNPFTDSWSPLPTSGAPGSRTGHTAVWTGERMIVWGGRELPSDSRLNDGAIYHPGSDSWTGISPYDAPQARALHAAVWTGTEMIIWGGDFNNNLLNTGGRYNPATGQWTPTTQASAPRQRMFWRPDLGIWTGRGMLVCGGSDYPASLDSTAFYTVFDPPCPPVIREQPQSVSVVIGSPVTLVVGAQDCATAVRPSSTQASAGPYPHEFVFETGAGAGQLQFDYDFFGIPDSLRVYYEGQMIFDSELSGQGTIRVPFGPGVARSVTIVVNESGAPASTAGEYTVTFRPEPLRYQWRKGGDMIAGETNATLHFPGVSLADAGDYSVIVANNNSSVISAVATMTVLSGPQSTNCVPAPAGLVAWWSFEATSLDRVNGIPLQLSGDTTYVSGLVGQGLHFDGNSDEAMATASPLLDVGAGEGFSIETWVNPASVTMQPLVEWRLAPGVFGVHFWIGAFGAGSIYANIADINGNEHRVRSDTDIVVPNVFQHLGMSYEKTSGLVRLYLNGRKVTEESVGTFTPRTTSDLLVGFRGGSEYFTGTMDELSIYRRVLTDAEMASTYNAGTAGKCGTNAVPCTPSGLVAWWRGDGDATDVTGAHNGTLLYGTTFSPGVSGQAFTFDLSRARVSIPDDDAFKLTDSLSFEGWIKVASHAPGLIFIRGDNRGGLDPYQMSIQPSGQLHWGINTAENTFAFVQSPGAVPIGEWLHVAAVLDGATGDMGLYVNGVLVNQTNTTLRPLRDLDPNSEPTVGIGNHGGTFHHFPYHGSVDDWALYSRALSATEILGIYTAGAAGKCATNPPPPTNCVAAPAGLVASWRGNGDATDATGAHNGTLLYGTTFSPGVAGQAFTFDLSRARVSIPDNDAFKLTDSLSFEGWIKVASYAPGIIFIRGDNRGGLDPYHMSVQPSGQLHWGINTAENTFAFVQSPGAMPIGEWLHVAAVLDGATGNLGLYVNGSLVNQTNTTLRPLRDLDPNSEPTLGIGNHGGTFHHFPFHGSVDEWALYSRALNASEIQGIFQAGAAGKCSITNPPPSGVFDLSSDFSLAANPNGPWSYGHRTNLLSPNIQLLNTSRTFGAENGVPIDIWQLNNNKPWVAKVIGPGTAVSTHFVGPPGTIYFGPNPEVNPEDFAVIRFTVPSGASGTYRLETSVRSLYDSTRSVDADFHVVKNSQQLFGALVPPNSAAGYSNVLTLAAGDRIDFVAGRGTNGLPETGLKIQVTLRQLPPIAAMGIDAVSFVRGSVRVTGHGPPGGSCRVERSMNLIDWEPVGSAVETAAGIFEFTDVQPPAGPACFYRLK